MMRRRLLAADVAADGLRSLERDHHALGQVALRGLEGLRHGRPDLVVRHEVRLHRVALPDVLAGGLDVLLPGVGGDAPLRVDHGHLPDLPLRVGGEQAGQRVGRALPGAHHLEPQRAVARIDEGLGGDGAHAGLGPGDGGAHREPVGLDGHADLPGGRVAGDDGVGVDGAARDLGCGEGPGRPGRRGRCGARIMAGLYNGTRHVPFDRAAAWSLLAEFTPSQPLRRHALSVEATMRALARSRGVADPAEVETWGVVGLLHDFDYERFPTEAGPRLARDGDPAGAGLARAGDPRRRRARLLHRHRADDADGEGHPGRRRALRASSAPARWCGRRGGWPTSRWSRW